MSDKTNDPLIRDLENILEQLREGHSETSSALAADLLQGLAVPAARDQKRLFPSGAKPQHGLRKRVRRFLLRKRVRRFLLRGLVALVLLGGVGVGAYAFLAHQNKPTVSTFVTGVQGMAKLATAEAYVMTTIEGSDNKLFGFDISADIPGTKRHYMIIVPAKILSGVDLQHVDSSDIKLDDSAKTVEITLPHAAILDDAIQMNDVKVYTEAGLLRGATTAEEGVNLIAQASVKERLRQQAEDAGLLKTAEDNATQALQKLYDQFGYHVIVSFR